jgi:predicted RNA methylase
METGFITFLVAALGARRVEGVDVDLTLITRALKSGFPDLVMGPKPTFF